MRVRFGAVRGAVLLAVVTLAACSPGPDQAAGPVEQRATGAEPAAAQPSGASAPTPAGTSANGASPAIVVGRATAFTTVDLGACLTIARKVAEPSEALCPGFIGAGLVEMIATCADVGGRLEPGQRPSLRSLDVDGDGRAEFLYDATENYRCDGAPSLFSCGSLGCPVSLFERHAGGWSTIGVMSAEDAPAAEVLTPAPGARYGTLRGGCAGDRPCEEWTYYLWDGSAYQDAMIEARGHWVDIANGGLWTLVKDMSVLAAPSPDAAVLERYPMGTEVVVIGDARGAPYKYVSPCNACQSGFIDPAALRKTY